ncbi:MAG: hypothetical protein ACOZNI_16730 [Myxococcota bacterium]
MLEEAPMVCVHDGGQAHVLRAGDEVVARLVRTGATTTRAEARDAEYDIVRVGFVRPRVVVRPKGSLSDVAALVDPATGHGAIEFADGARYGFDWVSPAGGECAVRDPTGRPVLTMRREVGPERAGAAIRVDRSLDRRTATVLAMLSWHVLLLDLEDLRRPVTVYNGPERRKGPREIL